MSSAEEVQSDDDDMLELWPEEDISEIYGIPAQEDLGFWLDADQYSELF